MAINLHVSICRVGKVNKLVSKRSMGRRYLIYVIDLRPGLETQRNRTPFTACAPTLLFIATICIIYAFITPHDTTAGEIPFSNFITP